MGNKNSSALPSAPRKINSDDGYLKPMKPRTVTTIKYSTTVSPLAASVDASLALIDVKKTHDDSGFSSVKSLSPSSDVFLEKSASLRAIRLVSNLKKEVVEKKSDKLDEDLARMVGLDSESMMAIMIQDFRPESPASFKIKFGLVENSPPSSPYFNSSGPSSPNSLGSFFGAGNNPLLMKAKTP